MPMCISACARAPSIARLTQSQVSATMHIAHMAGIEVFVTGGIGGVHRLGRRRRPGRATHR